MQLTAHLRQHSPALRVATARGRLEAARMSIGTAMRARLMSRRATLMELAAHLRQHSPAREVAAARGRLEALQTSIGVAARRRIDHLQGRLGVAARTLDAVSPLATLQRGYAIVTSASGTVVTDAETTQPGSTIEARLARGSLIARVEQVKAPAEKPKNPIDDVK